MSSSFEQALHPVANDCLTTPLAGWFLAALRARREAATI
jgi:hypothetical protein